MLTRARFFFVPEEMKTHPGGKGDASVSSMAESAVVENMSRFLIVSL
jgi:hypothetical protein